MKKILSVLAIILAPYFIVACSSDSKEDTIPEEPQMTLADYQGVWEDIHNDTAFSFQFQQTERCSTINKMVLWGGELVY